MEVEYNDPVVKEQGRYPKLQQLQGYQITQTHYEDLGEGDQDEDAVLYLRSNSDQEIDNVKEIVGTIQDEEKRLAYGVHQLRKCIQHNLKEGFVEMLKVQSGTYDINQSD